MTEGIEATDDAAAPARARAERAEPHDRGPATDTAGVPWARRELSASGFENDTGASDPVLVAALAADDEASMMALVAAARFLVAVVAHADDAGEGAHGPNADAGVDMALVTLLAPDGRKALPAFTGVAALAAWDPTARPVPVTADRLAQAAIAEGCDVVVLDPGSDVPRELRPSQVWALAMRREWTPPHTDPFVLGSVAAALAGEPEVLSHDLYAAHPAGTLGIALTLRPGLGDHPLQALLTRVGERLATDGEFRARIDGLAFRLT